MDVLERLESQEWYNGQHPAQVLALVEYEIDELESSLIDPDNSAKLSKLYKERAALTDELQTWDEVPF